jgi:4-carboxymuconolactone decarboxylase
MLAARQQKGKRMKWILGALLASGLASSAYATDRFPPLTPAQMTPRQKEVADAIMASRKNLSGPFPAWLRSPEMADRFQKAGEYVRYNTALPKALSEFVILVTAREWTCQIEWYLHVPEATAAGVNPKIIADIAARKRPSGMNADQTMLYDFGLHMHRDHGHVPEALFNQARARFGDKGVVDIIGINGYYDAVAMTINAADAPMPPGVKPPLD